MAHFVEPELGRDAIDAVVARFKSECLGRDGSLLFDDRVVWSDEHLSDFRRRFLGHPMHGKQTFIEKLRVQLDGAEDDVRWLATEAVAIYLLFAYNLIGSTGKVSLLNSIAEPLAITSAPHWDLVERAMHQGIGNPGVGYNTARDRQVGYLIDFVARWKRLPPGRSGELLDHPWQLRDFADATDQSVGAMRHIILHLLRPNEFERSASSTHKNLIVKAFEERYLSEDGEPEDVDERLLAIRRKLEAEGVQADEPVLDFYRSPLVEEWHPKYQDEVEPSEEPDGGSPEICFILNQLEIAEPTDRAEYHDEEGKLYAWSSRSSGSWRDLANAPPGTRFAYYRPRTANDGSSQSYFGAGEVEGVKELTSSDSEAEKRFEARLRAYRPFDRFIPLAEGPKRNAQTSIERVDQRSFDRLLERGYAVSAGPWKPVPVEKVAELAQRRGLRLPPETIPSLVAAVNSRKHVIITGPPGTAKTTLAQILAEVAHAVGSNRGFLPTTATADWTTYETIGGLKPQSDQSLQFEEGHFLTSIRNDQWLLIDELNRSNFDRAFGQLFTVLSGQPVVLPFRRPGETRPIVLVPPNATSPIEDGDELQIGDGWRVIATMNVFDKDLLFNMSYALMRRFAFIEVPAPDSADFVLLIERWSGGEEAAAEIANQLLPLREVKDIGPAVFKDIATYAAERLGGGGVEAEQVTFECFYAFLLPQFEGLDERRGRDLFNKIVALVSSERRPKLRETFQDVLGITVVQPIGETDLLREEGTQGNSDEES